MTLVGKYYPETLLVDCPTHGRRQFEMHEEHDMYVCPDRQSVGSEMEDDWIAWMILEGIEPDGTCRWVVPLETLHDNPDGGEPIMCGMEL